VLTLESRELEKLELMLAKERLKAEERYAQLRELQAKESAREA
jgi:hypothetical protein